MRKYPETANGLTYNIIRYLRIKGYHAERIAITGIPYIKNNVILWRKSNMMKGTSDIHACIRGTFVAIEVKINDEMSIYQNHYKNVVIKAGGIYIVVRNFKEFEKWLKEHEQEK